ncbi:DDE family endonuclease [Ceratobasidium sp. AG-Ba]|nr:DDE family endonuclease [Ceratobasidium sp. AG-Ba]
MPRRSRKSEAAKEREARRNLNVENEPPGVETCEDPHRHEYRPQNPECQPYWDAFYANPYPSKTGCHAIAVQLGSTFATIRQWFKLARRYTHAPDRGPDSDDEQLESHGGSSESDSDSNESKDRRQTIKGTLYEHFYSKIHSKVRGTKRNRGDTVVGRSTSQSAEVEHAKKSRTENHHHGPRGPNTGQSRTTIWRHRKHVQKCASDIRSFFPSAGSRPRRQVFEPETVLIESDSDSIPGISEGDAQSSAYTSGRERAVESCNIIGSIDVDEPLEQHRSNLGTEDRSVTMPEQDRGTENAGVSLKEATTIREYQHALELLEASTTQLKLDIPTPSMEPPQIAPPEVQTFEDKGPTIQDAEVDLQESRARLHGDGDCDTSKQFYSTK